MFTKTLVSKNGRKKKKKKKNETGRNTDDF